MEIPIDRGSEALDKLPFSVVNAEGKDGGCWYKNVNFKVVPDWPKAAKAATALSQMLELSGGKMILHTSLRACVRAWSSKHELALSVDQVDKIAYSIRAIIAQLRNMKKKTRKIPQLWKSKFQVIYDKIEVDVTPADVRPAAPVLAAALFGQPPLPDQDADESSEVSDGET